MIKNGQIIKFSKYLQFDLLSVHELKRGSGGHPSNLYVSMSYPGRSNDEKNRSPELISTDNYSSKSQPQISSETSELEHACTSDQAPKRW